MKVARFYCELLSEVFEYRIRLETNGNTPTDFSVLWNRFLQKPEGFCKEEDREQVTLTTCDRTTLGHTLLK